MYKRLIKFKRALWEAPTPALHDIKRWAQKVGDQVHAMVNKKQLRFWAMLLHIAMPVRACYTTQSTVLGALKAELLLADQHAIQVSIYPVARPDLHAANHNPHLQGGQAGSRLEGWAVCCPDC